MVRFTVADVLVKGAGMSPTTNHVNRIITYRASKQFVTTTDKGWHFQFEIGKENKQPYAVPPTANECT